MYQASLIKLRCQNAKALSLCPRDVFISDLDQVNHRQFGTHINHSFSVSRFDFKYSSPRSLYNMPDRNIYKEEIDFAVLALQSPAFNK